MRRFPSRTLQPTPSSLSVSTEARASVWLKPLQRSARITTGNSRPLDLCTVIRRTAPAAAASSDVTQCVEIPQKAAQAVAPAGLIAVGQRRKGVQLPRTLQRFQPRGIDGKQHRALPDFVKKPTQGHALRKVAQFRQERAEIGGTF